MCERDGRSLPRLTNKGQVNDNDPTWSADGRRIAFTTDRDGKSELYVMNADGSSQTRLTNDPAGDFEPAWSPDGSKIAFTTDRDGAYEVYAMNADGSGQTNLTSNAAVDELPDWQPVRLADLVVSLTPILNPAERGRLITYVIGVSNAGPDTSDDVVVLDDLPDEARFVSAKPSQGTCSTPKPGSIGKVSCSLASLTNGGKASVQLEAIVVKRGNISDTAAVSADTFDPNPQNNSATVITEIK